MVAVLSGHDGKCSERLLQLGLSGVQTMVDLSRRDGWRRLRSFVGRQMAPMASHLLSGICAALDRPTLGTKRFFESLVVLAPRTTNTRLLCKRLNVCASTFTSRFFRSCLPSPKRYLSAIRLVHAAALLQVRGLSIGDVAYRLDFSSPQSFSRHIKAVTGMTGGEFRERVSFGTALDDFASQMILPHRVKFRTFHPF
jgi:AraC-like DNA-binding protein